MMLKLYVSLLLTLLLYQNHAYSAGLFSCKSHLKHLFSSINFMGHEVKKVSDGQTNSFKRLNLKVTDSYIVQRGGNPKVNKIIEEIEKHGGEVRLLVVKGMFFRARRQKHMAYFSYDHQLKRPIIAIEQASSWSTLMHEYTHFQDWVKIKESLISKGKKNEDAANLATDILLSPKQRWQTEVNAVRVELEIDDINDFSQNHIRRKIYPELTTAQKIYDQKKISKKEIRLQRHLMRNAIMKTLMMIVARKKSEGADIENYYQFLKRINTRALKNEMNIYSYRYEIEELFDSVYSHIN